MTLLGMATAGVNTPIIDPLAAVPPPIIPKEDNSLGYKLKKIKPVQYFSMGAIVVVVAIGVGFLANVARFSGDVRSRASGIDTPEPTPAFCNTECSDTIACPGGLKCVDGKCRNAACFGSSTCVCAPMPKK